MTHIASSTFGELNQMQMPVRVRQFRDQTRRYVYAPRRPARPVAARLASNESAFGPLPGVLDAIAAPDCVTRYPDPHAIELCERIAGHVGVGPDRVTVGAGSVGIVEQVIRLVVGPGDEVVVGSPTFAAYATLSALADGRVMGVPVAGTRLDLSAMAAAVTPRTRVAFVCTPNNPTGGCLLAAEVDEFLRQVPPDLLVVVDEAYREFVRTPDAVDGIRCQTAHDNVLVVRTFSKAYGLAGLRVGYGVGHPSVIAALHAVQTPFAVGASAQRAAIASLGSADALSERVAQTISERGRIIRELGGLGHTTDASDGNFVWLPVGAGAATMASDLEQAGILVRPVGDQGIRVTVGSPAENDMFLAALAGIRWPETSLEGAS